MILAVWRMGKGFQKHCGINLVGCGEQIHRVTEKEELKEMAWPQLEGQGPVDALAVVIGLVDLSPRGKSGLGISNIWLVAKSVWGEQVPKGNVERGELVAMGEPLWSGARLSDVHGMCLMKVPNGWLNKWVNEKWIGFSVTNYSQGMLQKKKKGSPWTRIR